jgi:hypothetical protein
MNEKRLETLIRTIEKDVTPPQGLKEEMLARILMEESTSNFPLLNRVERLIFESPLRAACALSPLISGILWAIMGKGYLSIVPNIIGIR